MKKLALMFFVILGLASIARAQNNDQILTMPISAPCLPFGPTINSLKEKHGERAFVQGIGTIWNTKIDEYVEVNVLIFLNPTTYSFTLAYHVPGDDLMCIISTGDKFEPVPQGKRL